MTAPDNATCPSWCDNHENEHGDVYHLSAPTHIDGDGAELDVRTFRNTVNGSGIFVDGSADMTVEQARQLITVLQDAIAKAEEVTP